MPFVETLLSQGIMGILAGIFLWLYLAERKRAHKALNDKLALTEEHHKTLDAVRCSQIERERGFSATLEEYGRALVGAVEKVEALATELRRIYQNDRTE